MGRWWIGAVAAVGCVAASAAAYAQPVPFLGPNAPPPPVAAPVMAPVMQPPGPAPTFVGPPPPPSPPEPPPVLGGGDRGFDNAFDQPCPGTPAPCFHADFEYLGVWTKHDALPILATQGSVFDPVPGALGQPNTVPLIAGPIDHDFHSGGRVTLSCDCGCDRAWTWEASAFGIQNTNGTATASGSGAAGSAVIARPFFNATNSPGADLIAVPGVLAGSILVEETEQAYGAEMNARWNYWEQAGGYWAGSILFGGRVLSVDERLNTTDFSQVLGAAGNSISMAENFSAHNYFYGPQIGAAYSWSLGPVAVDVVGKVALGVDYENLSQTGGTRLVPPIGPVTSTNAALLVRPSNAGSFHHYEFAVAPELLVNAGYAITDNIRVGGGYDFLYLSRLLRPGGQIDPVVGPTQPAVLLGQSSWWMQGFSASLEFSF